MAMGLHVLMPLFRPASALPKAASCEHMCPWTCIHSRFSFNTAACQVHAHAQSMACACSSMHNREQKRWRPGQGVRTSSAGRSSASAAGSIGLRTLLTATTLCGGAGCGGGGGNAGGMQSVAAAMLSCRAVHEV